MQVPHNVKVFMWRACVNALPTNLFRRNKTTKDPISPLYGLMAENTGHILLGVWGC
jgi:hypothetical protein